jgi:purine nucleosidase/pyrimidine-specific ribonucleoside hydrolase
MIPVSAMRTVIDTDPGIDDAIAILFALASPEFSIAGITTVGGNIGLASTTRNAGRLLALSGRRDIPVVQGVDAPLVRPAPAPLAMHGDDGLGGIALPEPDAPPDRRPASEWLSELLLDSPARSIQVLALGPLTNLALLLRDHPAAAGRIARVVAMGGTIREPGNAGPHSEFNFASDPEATAMVLGAGLPLTVVPLDVTRRVRATRDWSAGLAASGAPAAVTVSLLTEAYFASSLERETRPLHDPCVMLYAVRPELFGCETMHLSVDTQEGPGAGDLVSAPDAPAISIAMTVDGRGAIELLRDRLTGNIAAT